MLNYFPVRVGVSAILSTNTIMYVETLHYKRHLRINIGQYFQVHEHYDNRNIQLPHTKGSICLGPSGNEQGGFRFMCLNSEKNVTRRSWDTIPMSDTSIARVNKLAFNETYQFIITDHRGRPIGDIEITGMDRYASGSNLN